jgi:hypothetical protein
MFQRHAKKDLDEEDWQIMIVLTNRMDPLLIIDNILNGTYKDNGSNGTCNEEVIESNLINNETNHNDINDSNDDMMMIDDENYSLDSDQSMEIEIADYEKAYEPTKNNKSKHVHWGPETYLN